MPIATPSAIVVVMHFRATPISMKSSGQPRWVWSCSLFCPFSRLTPAAHPRSDDAMTQRPTTSASMLACPPTATRLTTVGRTHATKKPAVLLHPSRCKLPPMYFVTIFLSKFAHFTHQGTMKAEKSTSGSCGSSSTLSVDEAGFWRRTSQVQVILRAWSNAHARLWCCD